ncbi:MAG TPA: STAS domain-containing protein [Nocardioidaceae bacterium]|nr:STAS domain-containing protein [Nocardioidaceae bacterium]
MQLEIDVRPDAGRHIITPRGEIDLATQGQLKAVIEDLVVAGHVDLVLDLDQTTFLDSTGLGVLIGARRKAHAFKGSFAIVCSRRELLKLFRITSLDKVFTIHAADHALEVADGHGAGS